MWTVWNFLGFIASVCFIYYFGKEVINGFFGKAAPAAAKAK